MEGTEDVVIPFETEDASLLSSERATDMVILYQQPTRGSDPEPLVEVRFPVRSFFALLPPLREEKPPCFWSRDIASVWICLFFVLIGACVSVTLFILSHSTSVSMRNTSTPLDLTLAHCQDVKAYLSRGTNGSSSAQLNDRPSMLDGQREEPLTQRLLTDWQGLSTTSVLAMLTRFLT